MHNIIHRIIIQKDHLIMDRTGQAKPTFIVIHQDAYARESVDSSFQIATGEGRGCYLYVATSRERLSEIMQDSRIGGIISALNIPDYGFTQALEGGIPSGNNPKYNTIAVTSVSELAQKLKDLRTEEALARQGISQAEGGRGIGGDGKPKTDGTE